MNRYFWLTMVAEWLHSMANALRLSQAWQYLATPLGCMTALAIVTLACGVLVERFALVLCGITSVVLILGVAWPLLTVLGLRANLEFDRVRTPEGRAVDVTMRVINRWPLPVWGLRIDGLADCPPSAVFALAVLRPWSSETFSWSFTPPLRGVYPARQLHLVTRFPFGLVSGQRRVDCSQRLFVSPRSFPLNTDFRAESNTPWDPGNRLRSAGGHGDIVSLRPYRVGDSMRRIHWAQTARHEQIVVCEREAFMRPAVELFVDLRPQSHVGNGPDSTLEWSLRIAVSICQAIMMAGGNARCVIGDRVFDLAGQPRQWQSFLDSLSAIPRQGLPVAERPHAKQPSSGRCLLITSDAVDYRDSDALPQHAIRIVLRRCAFADGLPSELQVATRGRTLSSSACVILDSPDRVPAQLARGLQMEIGRC